MLPDLKVGGGQTLLLENIRSLDSGRFRHTVCHVRSDDEMAERFREAGAEIIGLEVRSRRQEPRALRRLLATVERRQVSIIHANNTPPDLRFSVLASRLRRLPLVVSLHGGFSRPRRRRARLYKFLIWRLARRDLAAVVAVSEPVHEAWAPHFRALGLPEDRLRTITPALDLTRFPAPVDPRARARVRAGLGFPDDLPVLLNVSRLVPRKGHGLLLQLMARLRHDNVRAVLVLAGEGPLRTKLEAEIARRGLAQCVRLLGNVGDVPGLLAGADLFVFPSEAESFGLAPLEAMAAGVPVVAADLPVLSSFLQNGVSGIVTPQGDAEALAAQVRALLGDAPRRARIAAAAREVVEAGYSTQATGGRLQELYIASLTPEGRAGRI